MGRSYWFECPRCGYRTKVSGGADRGVSLFVQTILCRECRELYDAVTRLRIPHEPGERGPLMGWGRARLQGWRRTPSTPPSFQTALNRFPVPPASHSRWFQFKLQCPVSPLHRVEAWNEPDRCPRCGAYLEKNALPFRIWE